MKGGFARAAFWAAAVYSVALLALWLWAQPAARQTLPDGGFYARASGAVAQPGVIFVPFDATVEEALAAAGGTLPQAAEIEGEAKVSEHRALFVPYEETIFDRARINVNEATVEELCALSGIGEVTAQNIVDYRTQNGPFTSLLDLEHVSGIGPVKLQSLLQEARLD